MTSVCFPKSSSIIINLGFHSEILPKYNYSKTKNKKEGKGRKDKKVLASEVHRSLIYQHIVILVVQ